MATLTVQQVLQTGTVVTYGSAASPDKCAPGDSTWIEVVNGAGAPITVTVDSATPSNYGTDEDLVVSVTNGTTKRIGPLPASRFAGADGLVSWTYSSVTTITVAAVKV